MLRSYRHIIGTLLLSVFSSPPIAFFILFSARSFSIRIEPSGLENGAHFGEVRLAFHFIIGKKYF